MRRRYQLLKNENLGVTILLGAETVIGQSFAGQALSKEQLRVLFGHALKGRHRHSTSSCSSAGAHKH